MKVLQKIFPSLVFLSMCSLQLTKSKSGPNSPPYTVVYRWKQIDFNYDCAPTTREEMLKQKTYIPKNTKISAVKISGDRMFLYCPKLLPGVPSTVNWVAYRKQMADVRGPLLNPYPSWEMQKPGNCKAIQSVQASEIDQWDRMWIIDAGRLNVLSANPVNTCPPKIVLIDLNTDKVIFTYIFPADVVTRNNDFLRDVTIACTCPEDCILYISDILDARIIIYDHYRKRSWYVTHPSMKPDPNAANITILGQTYYRPFGISGIALSPRSQNHDALYYASIAGFTIYKVSTKVLMSAPCGSTLQDKDVVRFFTKASQSDGMTMDARGRLYYGSLEGNALEILNTNSIRRLLKERRLAQNNADLQWPDSFGFDDKNGYILLVTNRFQHYGDYNLSDYNFRVLRFNIDTKSYIY